MPPRINDEVPDLTAETTQRRIILANGSATAERSCSRMIAMALDWKPGEQVIIAPALSDEEARKKFPGGWKAPKPYPRLVLQPSV